ncbi:N-formylglutamate amidohydrolase, partial [Mesorhizobium sp. M00.F.Ca.ET.149.01.1.1]
MAISIHDAVLFPGSCKLKTAAEDFSVVPPFEIRSGAEQRVPFLFNSPHSGRHYPERFLAMAR